MFTHFGQRLKRDLKQLVDRRIEASELASGTRAKVNISYVLSGLVVLNVMRL